MIQKPIKQKLCIRQKWLYNKRSTCHFSLMLTLALGTAQLPISFVQAHERFVQDVQKITISGKIVTNKGESLAGVSVYLEGTSSATKSNADGTFQIQSTKSSGQLKIRLVGYKEKLVPFSGINLLTIQLESETTVLDEIVTVGYAKEKKINLTGAVASVDAKVLDDRPLANLGAGLQGMIGNLNISTGNGAPGKGSGFNIRGLNSINGGGPLILVDGAQMDPNLINPADVESVSVLKDAASSSIYGTQAAYGVILITTKKGKEGNAKINIQSNLAINQPTRIPSYLNSWEFANFLNETNRNSGGSDYYDQNYMDHVYAYFTDPKNNAPVFIDPNDPNKYLYNGNTDWIQETRKKTALMQNHSVSISGRSDKTSYYGSVGMLSQEGFLKHYDDSYKRYNLNLNLSSELKDWMQVRLKSRYNHAYRDMPFGTNSNDMESAFYGADLRPLMPVYHPDGNFSGQGSWTNMVAIQEISGTRRHKENDVWIGGGLTLKPLKSWNINVDYNFNMYSINKKYHGKEILEHTANPNIVTVFPHTSPSSVEYTNDDNYYHNVRAFTDYEYKLEKHQFKFLAGYDFEKKSYRWFNAKRVSLISNDLGQLGQAIGEKYNNSGERANATMGYFGRINYNYDDRYLLEVNGRYDGSSRFPSVKRFAFFPSVSGAWRISNEAFFSDLKQHVNELKFRASYGQLGNQSVGGDYPYIPTMSTNAEMGYIIDGKQISSVNPPGLVSPFLTWETVRQLDFGLDWSMFNNRLTGTFDWYRRNTLNMVTSGTPLPAILGTAVPQENSADLKTTGWELNLGWQDHKGDLSYGLHAILSDNKGTITRFNNPQGQISTHYAGKVWGEIWGYETEGLFQSVEEITQHANQSKVFGGTWNPGDVKYKDLNGDGEISEGKGTLADHGDLKIIGNSEPRYSFGFRGDLKWKNIDFDFFIQGIGKRNIMPGGNQFWGFGNEWHVPFQHSLDSWREDNKDAYFPRSTYDNVTGNRKTQTRYLQNAAYGRLKSVSIGYSLPQHILSKVKIDRVRFYVTGENLVTVTSLLKLYDPETINVGAYPLYKSISFGVNLTL
ncbi:TonB-dependent receptor [Sphingobacterium sp. SRCM116780]|uniref:SusC/RagA family TonB-linked outer membrane protein n=1 Tax=Sphingobacterium sp. SRCM116780 TaxID=2907623 RepID=UPI001F38A695|nr:TonB-dependent receptor [Sphingobacterium sp. SRCM116780]UIR55281.1 TonB-dependent receptor [Sphingobacterium sp. SRCM116780]